MDIRPIRTEADYEAALAEIDRLWGATYGSSEGDKLDILATLIEAYEEKCYPIEASLHQLESRGLTRRDLEQYLGSQGRVSEIMNRKRPLSLEMVRSLQAGLGVSAEILVQPYQLLPA